MLKVMQPEPNLITTNRVLAAKLHKPTKK